MNLYRACLSALSATLLSTVSIAAPPPSVTTAPAASVLIDRSGYIVAVNVVSGASAGYVVVVDSATVPADGAIVPIKCLPVAITTGVDWNWRSDPVTVTRGAAVMFSTGASCFALVKSATAYISVEMR